MTIPEIIQQFADGMQQTGWLEFIAVVFGIAGVWFQRIENVLVFPVGMVNTVIYIYLSIKGHLLGEASVNLYYTVMSVYGWLLWVKKDHHHRPLLHITRSTTSEWFTQLGFFTACYLAIFVALSLMKRYFAPGAIPWADALASAAAYTGMWLMARKKIESWYWWMVTNIASIPLYFVKGYVFTSVFYLVLLIMAIWGLAEWRKRAVVHSSPFNIQ